MLFYEYFRSLTGSHVAVELKNGMSLAGTLASIDPFLNAKLGGVRLVEGDDALGSLSVCSIRGSAIKTIRTRSRADSDRVLTDATRLRCCLGK